MSIEKKYIGIFDSGVGGLTVYKDIQELMPEYDFIYFGDNGRAPYGNKSFESVYRYTLQCVNWLISQGAHLIILACNTASARALRSIQMSNWDVHIHDKRILGVIRPTAEYIPALSQTKHIGIVATQGTVTSQTYPIEFHKIDSNLVITQKACPLWVPLIENNQVNEITESIIEKDLKDLFEVDPHIDSLLLGCTHYPHIIDIIRKYTPEHIQLFSQGKIVAESLKDYLSRHTWLDNILTKNGTEKFYTTDSIDMFKEISAALLDRDICIEYINPDMLK